jgi:hypothetical protein
MNVHRHKPHHQHSQHHGIQKVRAGRINRSTNRVPRTFRWPKRHIKRTEARPRLRIHSLQANLQAAGRRIRSGTVTGVPQAALTKRTCWPGGVETADAEEFRRQSETCLQPLRTALKLEDKTFWLSLAEDLLELTEMARSFPAPGTEDIAIYAPGLFPRDNQLTNFGWALRSARICFTVAPGR